MNKKYLIPVTSVLVLNGQGCADPVIGDWEIVEAMNLDLPTTYSGSYYGFSYTTELSGKGLEVNANFGGKLTLGVEVDINYYGYSYSDSALFHYDVEVLVSEKRSSYRIKLEGDFLSFDLDCTMSGRDLLECEDDDNADWEFWKE